MSRPNTRQSSVPKTVNNPSLVELSGKSIERVVSRGSTSAQNRGRGTTPVGRGTLRRTELSVSQSNTSVTALRDSSVSHSLESCQFTRTGEIFDSFGREIPSGSETVAETESLHSSVSGVVGVKENNSSTPEEMATGGENRESGIQSSSGRTMDDLLAYLQEAMRSTQDEFRRELAALRETMETRTNNGSTSVNPGINVHPSGSQANSSIYVNPGIKLKDWKISYSGESSVSDFLFKLDTLVERSQCPHEHLMTNFHIFLTGKAEIFYWDYIRQFQRATYPMLRTALLREFGSKESDQEILLRISTRKQLPKESYDDYHSFIVRWNLRLTTPLTDEALIEIIKKNVHAYLKVMLFIASPADLGTLRDLARKAEKILSENRNVSTNRSRQVNEIAAEATTTETPDEEFESDPQVEAMKVNRTWVRGDYSGIKCWNCLQLGHSYIYCPEETRHVFCYKCGNRGVTTVKCTGPHVGNRRRSEWATGDARSSE